MGATAEQASPWLEGRSFSSWQEEYDRRGYLIFKNVLKYFQNCSRTFFKSVPEQFKKVLRNIIPEH